MRKANTTCWSVIEGTVAGDEAMSEAFARTYRPVLHAYFAARWRASEADERVQEAVQRAFMECLKPRGALQRVDPGRRGGFRAFLFGIARNVAQDLERVRSREDARRGPPPAENLSATGDTASVAFDRAWARMLVEEALQRVIDAARGEPAAFVEVLRLRYFEGMKPREIAPRIGLRSDQVHQLLHRARRAFHDSVIEALAFRNPQLNHEQLRQRVIDVLELLA